MKLLHMATAFGIASVTMAYAMEINPEIDTNSDGVYSYPEMEAVFEDMTEDLFIKIDTNADGAIDVDEFAVAQDAELLPALDG